MDIVDWQPYDAALFLVKKLCCPCSEGHPQVYDFLTPLQKHRRRAPEGWWCKAPAVVCPPDLPTPSAAPGRKSKKRYGANLDSVIPNGTSWILCVSCPCHAWAVLV
jgi:hypothetical protein